jgi:oligo-1,6-glucosidase
MVEAGVDPEEALSKLRDTSRDNARTPYQLNDKENAGFTTGKPWIKVNPRYPEINFEADRSSPDSIFQYYKELIQIRKDHPAIVDGDFEFLMMDHPKMVIYRRHCARETLLVICNFSDDAVKVELPEELSSSRWERILTNYRNTTPSVEGRTEWLPWEAEIYTLAK